MKRFFWGLVLASVSYALNAPYLISATALSDSSVELSWRNNDAGTVGYILQRKDSTETTYHFLDSVKTSTQLTYTDMNGLRPSTLYTYQVIAYSATEVSDTSNSVQVTTLARTTIFNQPSISVHWNYDTSTSVRIRISDNANCETGYRIYRDQEFSSSFSLIAQITSTNPERMDSVVWFDNTASANTWYNYKVAAFTIIDSIFSAPCSTYTFKGQQPQQTVQFLKLSDFPVSCDSTGWSARSGDTIVLKENPSPAGMFSVIDVKDSAHPVFVGYIDSATALAYPLRSLIPVYLKSASNICNSYTKTRVITFQDRILVLSINQLQMYQIQDTNLVLIDSMTITTGNKENRILLLNDTLLAVLYVKHYDYMTTWRDSTFFYTIGISSSGLTSFPEHLLETAYTAYTGGRNECYRPYIQGFSDNKILVPIDCYYSFGMGGTTKSYWRNLEIDDHFSNRNIVFTDSSPYANAYNTGHYISSTENLCTNAFIIYAYSAHNATAPAPSDTATELFVSHVGDPHPYATAQSNNAIYRDDIHRQNSLQNILLDTLNKRVFLICNNNMTILGYERHANRVIDNGTIPRTAQRIAVSRGPMASSVTIVLPSHSRSCDLYFYDLSGRVVDRMTGVTSNAVLWRPKTRTIGCYLVMVRSGGEQYTAKFMVS
ncbi:MAG: fibronectin type III domain-containing protein [Chitinispirillaceae bacterium]|nr:fibronectin type III domain-containing protein [Chitinispirillaceae bacterium]